MRSFRQFFEAVKSFRIFLPVLFIALIVSAASAQNTKGDRPAPASGSVKENQSGRPSVRRKKSNTGGQIRTTRPGKVISSKNPFVNNPSREPSSGDRPSVAPRRVKTAASASQGRATNFSPSVPFISNPSSRPSGKDEPYRGGRTASGKRLVTRKPENRSVNIYKWSGPELNNIPRAPGSSERAWPENRTASGQKIVRREPPAQNRNIYPRRSVFINNPVAERRVSEKVSSRPDVPVRTVRSSDGSKVTRTKIAAQSISGAFVTPGKKNVYWGKYSPSRGRMMTDMYGRPLRRMDYRSPANAVFPKDTLQHVDRRTRRETPSSAKTPGYKTATRTGTAWQGDISGKKLRGAQRDPRRNGAAQSGQQRLQVAGLSGRRDIAMANPAGLKAKLALMLNGKSATMRRQAMGRQAFYAPGAGVFKRSVVSAPGISKGNIRTSARFSGNANIFSGKRVDVGNMRALSAGAGKGIGAGGFTRSARAGMTGGQVRANVNDLRRLDSPGKSKAFRSSFGFSRSGRSGGLAGINSGGIQKRITINAGNRDVSGFNAFKRKAQPGVANINDLRRLDSPGKSKAFRLSFDFSPGRKPGAQGKENLNNLRRLDSPGSSKAFRQSFDFSRSRRSGGLEGVNTGGIQNRIRINQGNRDVSGFNPLKRKAQTGVAGVSSSGLFRSAAAKGPGMYKQNMRISAARRQAFDSRSRVGKIPGVNVDSYRQFNLAKYGGGAARAGAIVRGSAQPQRRLSFDIRQRGYGRNIVQVDSRRLNYTGPSGRISNGTYVSGGVVRNRRTDFDFRYRAKPVQRVDAGGVIRQAERKDADRRRAALLAGGYSGNLKVSQPGRQEFNKRIRFAAAGGGKLPVGITEIYSRPAVGAIGRRDWEKAGMNQRGSRPGLAEGASFGGTIPVLKYKYTPVHTPSWVKVLRGDFRKSLKVEKPGDREDRLIAGYADRVMVNPFRNPYVRHPDADRGAIKKLRPDNDIYAVNGLQMKKSGQPDRVNVERTPMNYRVRSIDRSRLALTAGLTGKIRQGNYVHHPMSSRDALMVREPDRAFIRSALIQSNVRMRKQNTPSLHPDAKFAHLKENNVQGEKSLLTGVKMVFDKKLKRNELQPASVKEKVRRPRYDPREIGIWND